jgi:hypothetical protein
LTIIDASFVNWIDTVRLSIVISHSIQGYDPTVSTTMPGDLPWPEVRVGNANHANTAVVIIGAGISGICTAIDLVRRNNCRNFIILEKSSGVGGTWHDNKYPGCCCDVWSALYSLSYEQNCEWTREYPGQEEILAYLVSVAQKYKIYEHVRFNSSVEGAVWDEEAMKWRVDVKTAEGSKDAEFNPRYEIKTDFLVSAVGQLNQPKWPEIDGIEDFLGKKMHSARWDWSYDLQDKKIAILGNGESPLRPCERSVLTYKRLHRRPDRPRNRQSSKKHHHLPTHTKLGNPTTRRARDSLLARRLQIPPSNPLASTRCYDGFPRIVLRRCDRWLTPVRRRAEKTEQRDDADSAC